MINDIFKNLSLEHSKVTFLFLYNDIMRDWSVGRIFIVLNNTYST